LVSVLFYAGQNRGGLALEWAETFWYIQGFAVSAAVGLTLSGPQTADTKIIIGKRITYGFLH
jgi:hypothetical protein